MRCRLRHRALRQPPIMPLLARRRRSTIAVIGMRARKDAEAFIGALAKVKWSGNQDKYATALKSAVESSVGLQPMARSGPGFLGLMQDVLLPGASAIANQQGELEFRQQIRLSRLAGFDEQIKREMFAGMGDNTGGAQQPQGGDELMSLKAAADSMGIH